MIQVGCECGVRRDVPLAWAGKTAKCRCGRLLQIPNSAAPPSSANSAEPLCTTPSAEDSPKPEADPSPKMEKLSSRNADARSNSSSSRLGSQQHNSSSRSGRRRQKHNRILVASIISSAAVVFGLGALAYFAGQPVASTASKRENQDKPLAVDAQAVVENRQSPASANDSRLAPTPFVPNQVDEMRSESKQALLPRNQALTDEQLRGESIAAWRTFWKSSVDPAQHRLTLTPGTYPLPGIEFAIPNSGIDNFLIVGGTRIEPKKPLEKFVTKLSTPSLREVHTLREEIGLGAKTSDVSPSGEFLLEQAAIGNAGQRRIVLRLHSFKDGNFRDIPLDKSLLSLQFVSDREVLLHGRDHVLELLDLESAQRKNVHQFRGTQLTYWKLSPGKQLLHVFSGASPASLKIFAIDQGNVRLHAQKSLEMEREFVIHHAEISPNGRYLYLGLYFPRKSRKRLRLMDLETGVTIRDIEDSELPESLTFHAEYPVVTDDGSWLFRQGLLVNSQSLEITWRAEDFFPDFSKGTPRCYLCGENRALFVKHFASRPPGKQLFVAQLPQ